jgi:hypothetical protein
MDFLSGCSQSIKHFIHLQIFLRGCSRQPSGFSAFQSHVAHSVHGAACLFSLISMWVPLLCVGFQSYSGINHTQFQSSYKVNNE